MLVEGSGQIIFLPAKHIVVDDIANPYLTLDAAAVELFSFPLKDAKSDATSYHAVAAIDSNAQLQGSQDDEMPNDSVDFEDELLPLQSTHRDKISFDTQVIMAASSTEKKNLSLDQPTVSLS